MNNTSLETQPTWLFILTLVCIVCSCVLLTTSVREENIMLMLFQADVTIAPEQLTNVTSRLLLINQRVVTAFCLIGSAMGMAVALIFTTGANNNPSLSLRHISAKLAAILFNGVFIAPFIVLRAGIVDNYKVITGIGLLSSFAIVLLLHIFLPNIERHS